MEDLLLFIIKWTKVQNREMQQVHIIHLFIVHHHNLWNYRQKNIKLICTCKTTAFCLCFSSIGSIPLHYCQACLGHWVKMFSENLQHVGECDNSDKATVILNDPHVIHTVSKCLDHHSHKRTSTMTDNCLCLPHHPSWVTSWSAIPPWPS